MNRRVLPIVVFLLLAGGLTVAWLLQPEPVAPVQGGPLVTLGPHLRALDDGPDGEITARRYVEGTMETIAGSPRAPILEALASDDWGAQWAGVMAIPRYGPPDDALATALGPLLRAQSTRVRRLAATACGYLGAGFEQVEPGLEAAARDEDAGVRAEALGALAQHTRRAPALWPLFAEALRDPAEPARAAAAKGLARIELQEVLTPRHLATLRKDLGAAMRDETPDVRMYAVMAMGRMGPHAASEVPGMLALLDDPSTLVRGTAANALGEVGKAALPAIAAALATAGPAQAASLLWSLRVIGKDALPILEGALTHAQMSVRVQAALKLWELDRPPEPTARVLAEALEGTDEEARRIAARGFARMGTAGASQREVLERLRDDDDESVRASVRSALARIEASSRDG